MRKIILRVAIVMILFSSCQKQNCKKQQAIELERQLEQFQKDVSNTNLTRAQIEELTRRYEEKQKQIMAECR